MGDVGGGVVIGLVPSSLPCPAFVYCSKANSNSSLSAITDAAAGRSVLIAQN
jgi:hypothetical protein